MEERKQKKIKTMIALKLDEWVQEVVSAFIGCVR